MLRCLSVVLISLLLASCGEKDTYDPAHDYFSFANTDQVLTRHIALDLAVDFDSRALKGSVLLYMNAVDASKRDSPG